MLAALSPVSPLSVMPAHAAVPGPAGHNAIVDDPGCTQNLFTRNDDDSEGPFNLGFNVNWFGTTYSSLYVNNNGGVNLQQDWNDYSNLQLTSIHQPIIAPLFTDLDTRNAATTVVSYGIIANYNGHQAFCADWVNVGHYSNGAPEYSAQLLLVDRSDTAPGNVDAIFNYNWIADGSEALTVGYAAADGTSYEFPGSGTTNLADGNSTFGLVNNTLNSGGQLGRYTFPVRGGTPPAAQTISFDPIGNQVIGASPITLDATASSGLAVTYTASGACSVTGDQLSLDSTGACAVVAHQAGDLAGSPAYNPADDVEVDFLVTPPPLNVTTTSLPDATVGIAYDVAVDAQYGTAPYSWSVAAGALPAGLALDPATGHITGTPTVDGTASFTARATDAGSATADASLGIHVHAAPAVTTVSLAGAEAGVAYNTSLTATGGTAPLSWSVSAGSLPPGLTLDAGTGAITGTAATAGSSNFTVEVTDANGATATAALSIATVAGPEIAAATPARPLSGKAYWFVPSLSGGTGPFVWTIATGTLPDGLNLNPATGAVSGTATGSGASAVTLRATDQAGGVASRTFRFDVQSARSGYWLGALDGGVFSFGDARFRGSLPAEHLWAPVTAVAAAPHGHGYYLASADGGVFAFGARFYGSLGGRGIHAFISAMAVTPDGRGYWLASTDGRVFPFGDAASYGHLSARRLRSPVVGIAAAGDGHGYWLVNRGGALFSFGSANAFGRVDRAHLHSPIVGVASLPQGDGAWVAAANGAVYRFGAAASHGSLDRRRLRARVVGIAAAPDGGGYWLVAADGGVFAFGSAPFHGSAAHRALVDDVVGMTTTS